MVLVYNWQVFFDDVVEVTLRLYKCVDCNVFAHCTLCSSLLAESSGQIESIVLGACEPGVQHQSPWALCYTASLYPV